jgi:hypothetical protein
MEEKEEWKKPFHNALHKSDRKKKSLMRKRFKFQGFTFRKGEVKALPPLFPEFSLRRFYTLQMHLISTISSGNARR